MKHPDKQLRDWIMDQQADRFRLMEGYFKDLEAAETDPTRALDDFIHALHNYINHFEEHHVLARLHLAMLRNDGASIDSLITHLEGMRTTASEQEDAEHRMMNDAYSRRWSTWGKGITHVLQKAKEIKAAMGTRFCELKPGYTFRLPNSGLVYTVVKASWTKDLLASDGSTVHVMDADRIVVNVKKPGKRG